MTHSLTTLNESHIKLLADSAISLEVATQADTYSATEREDLPESLQYRDSELPGLVFTLASPTGRQVAQFRPDEPTRGKYGQEPGSGAVIALHPAMRERLDDIRAVRAVASTAVGTDLALPTDEGAENSQEPVTVPPLHVVAVEGTKQYLAFVSNCEDDSVVAFGVQGCGNWSKDGVPVADLDAVIEGADRLTVMFDGDRKTNYWVWMAGHTLKEHAGLIGVEDVRFASVAGGKKADLDGVLGKRAAETRPRYIASLLEKATANEGRCPAKPKPAKGRASEIPRVDFEAGVIYAPDLIQEVDGVTVIMPSEKVLARFAARIERTVSITDDLNATNADAEHDLEVRIEGDPCTYSVSGVPDGRLRDIPYWRNLAGSGRATRRYVDNSEAGSRAIETAVRCFEADSARFVDAYRRMGWVLCPDGEWRYLVPSGAIGPDGATPDVFAYLEHAGYRNNIAVPDPAEQSADAHRDALREFLLIGQDRLHNPTAWYAVVGSMAFASTGCAPRSGILVAGKHGSGKTVVTQTAATVLGPAFHAEGGRLMGSMNGTGNAVGSGSGIGLHHCHVIVDDIRRRQDPKKQDQQDAAVEDLIRRTYEGGSAGRARQRVDRDRGGRVVTDEPDASSPLVVLTGEYIPSAEAVGSSVERLLSIVVTAADTMKPGESDRMKQIGKSGRPAVAWSGWLRWQASEINRRQEGLAEWVAYVETRREQAEGVLANLAPELSNRAREVAAPSVVGWLLLLEYAVEIGALTSDEARASGLDCAQRITQAAIRHSAVELATDLTGPQRLLARIRSALSSGRARLADDVHGNTNTPVIGIKRTTEWLNPETGRAEQIQSYAFVPDSVASVLDGVGGTEVSRVLSEVGLRNAQGRPTWAVTINGRRERSCVVIPESVLDGPDESAEAPRE